MDTYKLMVVDDEYYIRDGLMSYPWENLGFTAVFSAKDGFEALSYIEKNPVQVVLTDICIPNMDGLSLCEIIRNRFPQCRLVLISGHKNFEYAKTAIKVGVKDYLLKPIDFDELEEVFKQIRDDLDRNREEEKSDSDDIKSHHSLNSAAEYIKRNYQENLTLALVAEQVSLSPAYFSTQFKKQTSLGFSEYLNQIRVSKAKQLLGQMNLKVYEVAHMVGFENAKYFTDIFKKATGNSPNAYRRILLEQSSGRE